MSPIVSLCLGLLLALTGWGAGRWVAGAGLRGSPLMLLHDGLAPMGTFFVILLAAGRPLLGGAVVLGAFGGFAFADHVKRGVLREPIVFTDMSEVVELFRHPEFYLPFAGVGRLVIGVLVVAAIYSAIIILRRPTFPTDTAWMLGVFAAAAGLILLSATVLLQPWARLLRGFRPSGDPIADAKRLGPFAMIGCYGIIARAERRARRAAAPEVGSGTPLASKPPVILVQSESFFDPSRLGLPRDTLPAFDAARRGGQSGRLSVSCWGANTTRTEFSALTGLGREEVGYDILNPYHAFARKPVPSLAWFFRGQGYRTICVHPFDISFYSRNRIMPLLGFDELVGQSEFAGKEGRRGYVTDAAVAEYVCGRLAGANQPIFVFVISMENHGPWTPGVGVPRPLPRTGDTRVEDDGLGDYLETLKGADAMIARLMALLEADGQSGLLGFYGDHMPSLPQAFASLDFHDTDTDYFLWRAGHQEHVQRNIAAQDLPRELLVRLRH